jgi:LDH2 family malate/lactate/ureidoglycolate dehydrogenase
MLAEVSLGERSLEALFDVEQLNDVAVKVLSALGAPQPIATTVSESLVLSNLMGHDSHGIVRLLQYSNMIKDGQILPGEHASVASRRGVTVAVDGGWGFGQPAAQLATRTVIEAATGLGIAIASISSCNHIGRLGEYISMITDAGMMGMAFCNSGPVVAPFGGEGRVMGTNPFAWGVPRDGQSGMILDFATANVAEGKLKIALAEGSTVVPGSIIDTEGKPSVSPSDFYAGGALVPFGAHKGSGLSMLIEVTSGILSRMGTSCATDYHGGNGTLILALDIAAFVPLKEYLAEVEGFCADAKRIGGGVTQREVLVPGEIEARTSDERSAHGIRVGVEIRRQITTLAEELGVNIDDFAQRAS